MKLTDENAQHIMIDIETWGLDSKSVICSIGAVVFNKDGIGDDQFYVENLSIKDQVGLFARTINPDTVRWWMGQSDESRKCFSKNESYGSGLVSFCSWIKKASDTSFYDLEEDTIKDPTCFIWSKGSFDINILEDAIRTYPLGIPWHYRNVVDLRTLSLLIQPNVDHSGVAHNALDDARNQALQGIDILRRFKETCGLAATFVAYHGSFSSDDAECNGTWEITTTK